VSFDLYVFDLDRLPTDDDAMFALLEEDDGPDDELTPALTAFVAELEHRFPSLDDDPDGSPWASWPLTQSVADGRGCAFNIVWSAAEAMNEAIAAAAAERGLLLYDPQGGDTSIPSVDLDLVLDHAPPKPAQRSWWKRKR
jgi:hypothetical protein